MFSSTCVRDTSLKTSIDKQIYEKPDILQLICLAKNRSRNGRLGDRALQKLLEHVDGPINYHAKRFHRQNPCVSIEDMRMESIKSVIERLEEYDETRASFKTWVNKIAWNRSYCIFRSHCQRSSKEYLADELDQVCFDESEAKLPNDLQNYISFLPDESQKIIQLIVKGYAIADIARLLSKSYDAVRMMYSRALKKIKS